MARAFRCLDNGLPDEIGTRPVHKTELAGDAVPRKSAVLRLAATVCGLAVAAVAIFGMAGCSDGAEKSSGDTTVSRVVREDKEEDDDVDRREIEAVADPDTLVESGADQNGNEADNQDAGASDAGAQQTWSYVCPESSSRVLSDEELYAKGADWLELARNEIYARYGRGFATDYLQEYFDAQPWYTRRYSPEEFDAMPTPLNSIEQQNATNMLRVEKDLRG